MRNGAPRSVAKGRRVMTNEATPAILTWGIKLILISIANKATETCPEANISVEKREINIKKNNNQG